MKQATRTAIQARRIRCHLPPGHGTYGARLWRITSRHADSTPALGSTVKQALALLAVVLMSGCVTEFLVGDDLTTRNVACAIITLDSGRHFSIEVHRVDSPLDLTAAIERWRQHMELALEHPVELKVFVAPGPRHDGPWTAQALAEWLEERTILSTDELRLHIFLVPELSDGEAVRIIAPGVVAINGTAIGEAAAQGHDSQTVRRALIFHALGHVAGAVNHGIPIASPDASGREPVQHHEGSPRSVMSTAWHKVSTMPSTNATYDAYSQGIIDDWRAAKDGVCA